jgi:hypothetical protein
MIKEGLIKQLEEFSQQEVSDNVIRKVEEVRNEFEYEISENHNQLLESFLAGGGHSSEFNPVKDPLDGRFKELINVLDLRFKKFKKNRKEDHKGGLKAKEEIIDKLNRLISEEENIGRAFSEFKSLQQQWNDIGNVPSAAYKNLLSIYHRHVHNFYYSMKLSRDLRDLDLKKNLEFRLSVLERMNALLSIDSIRIVEATLEKLHIEWSELGPTSRDTIEDMRARFREAFVKVTDKIKAHYQGRQDEEVRRVQVKKRLIEDMIAMSQKEISSPMGWQRQTEAVVEKITEWRKSGYISRKQSEELWKQFKAALNVFYLNKKNFFGDLKKGNKELKEKKKATCEKAESFATRTDWDIATKEIIQLQRGWMNERRLEKREEDRMFKRFRAACDVFFEAKKEQFKEREEQFVKNLELKEAFIIRLKEFQSGDNVADNLKALKDFQTEWSQIGHVPMKDKDAISKKYHEALDKKYDEMRINQADLFLMKFRNKIEQLAGHSNGEELLRKERMHIADQGKKLEGTIKQYENNLGFFKNAKSAGSLLGDVEENLRKAKEEHDLVKKKLKIFSEVTAAKQTVMAKSETVAK